MRKARIQLIITMLFFGSVSLPVRALSFSSAQISLGRGVLGCAFLVLISRTGNRRIRWSRIWANAGPLVLAGLGMGGNWILLFQAYRYTSVATATLCYYFAPVLVLLLSPLLLKERLTKSRVLAMATAMTGMVCVIGAQGFSLGPGGLTGIFLGLAAAGLYAMVVLANQFLQDITGLERSVAQLAVASLFLLPYVAVFEGLGPLFAGSARDLVLLLVLGLLYTGVAYWLYFSAIAWLPAQTVALYSYIDPASAILFSALFFHEPLTPLRLLGGGLILGATFLPEVWKARREEKTIPENSLHKAS